jgi:hypothetical protein
MHGDPINLQAMRLQLIGRDEAGALCVVLAGRLVCPVARCVLQN